ncbi:hypothetical protein GF374_02670 [Candidatus Woesearchaeota archaeon]|nr:hypothetical protein [Candidatus Woesearchaeota archaeon]
MLNAKITKKINDSVYQKPRTIQEISHLIKKSWRTASRYVQQISKEHGTISVRTFRKGTRGALKIAYWNNIERIHSTEFRRHLFEQIRSGKNKADFSPSEIYQYVDEKNKAAKILTDEQYTSKENFEDYMNLLRSAESQVLFFSGNLTWSNMGHHDIKIRSIVEELAEKNIPSKILTRVEIPGLASIKNILAINTRLGKKGIRVRHCFQPLRATIVDNKVAVFKETQDPENYKGDELKEKITIIYYIYDKEWIEWLQKVFWNLYRVSISANKRIKDIEKIKGFTSLS